MPIRLFPSQLSRRASRALVAVVLGFQALLWGGGSIIEAKAAAESLSRYSHVEDQGTTACPPIHSHLDCLVCRTLSGGGMSGSAPTLVPVISSVGERPVSEALPPVERGRSGTLGSRAPPRVGAIDCPVA